MERQLGMVKSCSARLLDLVTNIMDLAHSEKRQHENRPQPRPTTPVNIATIIDEVVTMSEMAVDRANTPLVKPSVRIVTELPNEIPLTAGDSHKLTQMVYNLVTNATKFTERGTVVLAVRHIPEKHVLDLDVTDTGRGISEEGLNRIFEPVTQEVSGDARNFQGIGLGLTVSSQIATYHGGSIKVRSQLGLGSTWRLLSRRQRHCRAKWRGLLSRGASPHMRMICTSWHHRHLRQSKPSRRSAVRLQSLASSLARTTSWSARRRRSPC